MLVLALVTGACGTGEDTAPPGLEAPGFVDGQSVDADAITIAIVATDDRGVAGVSYLTDRGASADCPVVSGGGRACGPIPLVVGTNAVLVRAVDHAGNTASLVLRVQRTPRSDETPPTLTVTGVEDGATVTTSSIQLTAVATDDRGVAGVSYATDHGATGACGPPAGDAYPCGPIPLPLGETQVTISARDTSGNAVADARTIHREEAPPPPPPPTPPARAFELELVFFDHLYTPSQMAAFEAAAARWSELVIGDLEDLTVDLAANASCGQGEPAYAGTIDDVTVFVTSFTDGAGGLLGYAGPCLLRGSGSDAGLTAVGFLALDALDVAALEANGALTATIVHELGHVLGFGTLWEAAPFFDLLDFVPEGAGATCRSATGFAVPPTFNGGEAIAAWRGLGGTGDVPVEDEGGAGTRCGHWDEATFGNELMTGWLNVGAPNPLSVVTIDSLADLGYLVDATAADPYVLPAPGGPATHDRIDLGGSETLARPVGIIDPATGDVTPLPPHDR